MSSTNDNEPDLPEEPEEGEELLPLHPPAAPEPKPAVKTPGLPPAPSGTGPRGPVQPGAHPSAPSSAPSSAGSGVARRPPLVTPPAGLPAQGPQRPSGAAPARPSGAVPASMAPGRRSGMSPASNTPPAGAPLPPAQPVSVAGTMEAIQLLISLRSAASKVKQLTVVDQISHGLQSLGIKMPDSKGELPAMKTPTHAVAATAFIDVLVHVLNEAKKAKQFSLAERVRSGLEGLGYQVSDGPNHSNIVKRVKP